jgi:hypothetical protein
LAYWLPSSVHPSFGLSRSINLFLSERTPAAHEGASSASSGHGKTRKCVISSDYSYAWNRLRAAGVTSVFPGYPACRVPSRRFGQGWRERPPQVVSKPIPRGAGIPFTSPQTRAARARTPGNRRAETQPSNPQVSSRPGDALSSRPQWLSWRWMTDLTSYLLSIRPTWPPMAT